MLLQYDSFLVSCQIFNILMIVLLFSFIQRSNTRLRQEIKNNTDNQVKSYNTMSVSLKSIKGKLSSKNSENPEPKKNETLGIISNTGKAVHENMECSALLNSDNVFQISITDELDLFLVNSKGYCSKCKSI